MGMGQVADENAIRLGVGSGAVNRGNKDHGISQATHRGT